MLGSALLILSLGFLGGQITKRSGIPALVAMIIVGIFLQDIIDPRLLESGRDLRIVAVTVILLKAGLGLDAEKLKSQGNVALRLGFLPATFEAIVVAILSIPLFHFNWATGLLLGCIVGAESPAVIVPAMLKLKSLGWGVDKGIPDAILTGSALSNVLLLLVFNLLLATLNRSGDTIGWQLLPLQFLMQILLGILLGYILAWGLNWLLSGQRLSESLIQDTIVVFCVALGTVILAEQFPFYSGYLAVMVLGLFLTELNRPLARRLSRGFDSLWVVAEIFLFVLMGASINLSVLGGVIVPALGLLTVSTLLGRGIGWWLATAGSNWTGQEKLFLLPANSAKATVQAALGAIPLSYGIAGGETMLAVAALSILVTAPLGAWATPAFAPKLLQKGEVDPTKVAVNRKVTLLCAVDCSEITPIVLTKAAELARRCDGRVLVLYVPQRDYDYESVLLPWLQASLADIPYELLTPPGVVPETILRVAQDYQVDEIVMGRGQQPRLGSVSQSVVESSSIPVVVVTAPEPSASPAI
jgi:NhaP-type Na+/H+ or K+/H+ antiporter/nucleotide-binding universal stress UspA family protein